MANTYADRVQETSTTTGTGTYDLAGANTGYQTFVAGAGDASTVTYLATDGTDWEVGTGVVTDAATDTLSRASILSSSNGGAAVNWGAGTKTISLTLPAANFQAAESFPKYAVISDTKASSTDGGTFTSGSDQTRVLNTVDSDPDSIVSLSTNQFTLAAGTYLIRASAPAYKTNYHRALIYNVTDAAVVKYGTAQHCSSSDGVGSDSTVVCMVTIASSKAFELRHRCGTTSSSNGLGVGNTYGDCVFSTVEIMKVA